MNVNRIMFLINTQYTPEDRRNSRKDYSNELAWLDKNANIKSELNLGELKAFEIRSISDTALLFLRKYLTLPLSRILFRHES